MSKKKELQVLILIGLPGSGKSTWAKQQILKKKELGEEWVRINRDDHRMMLKNQFVCENKIENLINTLQDQAILAALNAKCNVIIDNTNVKEKYIRHFMELVQYKADIKFLLLDVGIKKAIEQDKTRPHPVGEEVIKKFDKSLSILKETFPLQDQPRLSFTYKEPPHNPELDSCFIFDIDGTLAHMNDKRGPFEWDKVHLDVVDQKIGLLNNILSLARLNYVVENIVVSGRDESCRDLTEKWLRDNHIVFDKLYMRPKNDNRSDVIVKEEIYNNHIKDKYNVSMVFDDRNQVVRMWRKLGLKCLQVEEGNF